MPNPNAEVVRRGFELWNAGRMDQLRDLYDPEAVLHHAKGWPEPGPSVGREAVFREFEYLRENWRTDRFELAELRAVGATVLVRLRWQARSSASQVTTELALSGLYRLRDGKVVEQTMYWDHGEALEAAGLGGSGASPEP